MIVWGGRFLDPRHFFHDLDTGGRYDPATDSWTRDLDGDERARRALRTHGGVDGQRDDRLGRESGGLSTGGRYDPATDGWTATSTAADAPEARGDHTAVWTGTEMIVWGGNGQSGPRVEHGWPLRSGDGHVDGDLDRARRARRRAGSTRRCGPERR